MASTMSFAVAIVAFLSYILLSQSPAAAAAANSPAFKKMYAFGDSFTDTGNTRTSTGPAAFNFVSNPPYGVTYFHHPTNRYSDGRVVVDFVAEALSLPFLPAYRDSKSDRSHGINFAIGGATAIRHGFFQENNISFVLVPQSLETQLVWFNGILRSLGCNDSATTPKQCSDVLGDALFWIGEIGANDYTASMGSPVPITTIRNLAVNSLAGFLQELVNKGARYIVVQGLPPAGCSPYSFALAAPEDRDGMGCVASVNKRIAVHNAAIQARLGGLRRKNPHAAIAYVDFYNAYIAVLKNARKLGFREVFKACCGAGGGEYNYDVFNVCGTPSSRSCAAPWEYINWDGAHFTEAMNSVLARSFLKGSFCSPPFGSLLTKKARSG